MVHNIEMKTKLLYNKTSALNHTQYLNSLLLLIIFLLNFKNSSKVFEIGILLRQRYAPPSITSYKPTTARIPITPVLLCSFFDVLKQLYELIGVAAASYAQWWPYLLPSIAFYLLATNRHALGQYCFSVLKKTRNAFLAIFLLYLSIAITEDTHCLQFFQAAIAVTTTPGAPSLTYCEAVPELINVDECRALAALDIISKFEILSYIHAVDFPYYEGPAIKEFLLVQLLTLHETTAFLCFSQWLDFSWSMGSSSSWISSLLSDNTGFVYGCENLSRRAYVSQGLDCVIQVLLANNPSDLPQEVINNAAEILLFLNAECLDNLYAYAPPAKYSVIINVPVIF